MQTFLRFTLAICLAIAPLKYTLAQDENTALNSWTQQLLVGTEPQTVATTFPVQALEDLPSLNVLRLRLKAANRSDIATNFFSALAQRQNTDAVLLNLSLTYVDRLRGKNLLQQGFLSTRSQSAVEQIIQRNPDHWLAWYIRGINNLYWPDWFGKAIYAQEYLTKAVAISKNQPPPQRTTHDMYALGYLTLGDAYALLDKPTEAERTWTEGLNFYPYVAELRQRLNLPATELHQRVRALRDVNQPIDTDLKFMWTPLSAPFTVTLTGGTLYGPGMLEDQPLKPGNLANLYLAGTLTGAIPAFNNGAAEPNLPGEILQGKTLDGLFSDGTPANENVDVGFVKLMNGKFNLFLAAIQDGPNQGRINFFLDNKFSWIIHDDIGIDPGFPIGVIKIYDFNFSTSPRLIPISLQTEMDAPAGVDRAGSIHSGAVVPGLLGDDDFDGHLDGILNAIGRFGFDSIILPGAPFAQTRIFKSDIPISSAQAALLTFANALQYLQTANHIQDRYPEQAATLRQTYRERLELARRHAERVSLPVAMHNAIFNAEESCTAIKLLQEIAPSYNLYRRDFNTNGIVPTVCSQ